MHFGSYLVHRRTVGSAHFLRQIVGSVFHSLGDMGDQDIAFDDADWSEDSNMGEYDPGAPLTVQASSDRNPDHTHADFAYKLKVQILPNDQENRGEFDNGVDFRIGDPNVHFRAAAAKSYETTEDIGKPDWSLLARMSHLRFLSTVYVLVDNRDLTNLDNPDPSLQHWPAVAAWWSSVTWFSSLSAKPVVFTWSTTHGQAPSSWQLSAWSFLVSTLCSLIATVYLSRFLKLKICGKKHSVCSMVGFQVQFQPAVGLGA